MQLAHKKQLLATQIGMAHKTSAHIHRTRTQAGHEWGSKLITAARTVVNVAAHSQPGVGQRALKMHFLQHVVLVTTLPPVPWRWPALAQDTQITGSHRMHKQLPRASHSTHVPTEHHHETHHRPAQTPKQKTRSIFVSTPPMIDYQPPTEN